MGIDSPYGRFDDIWCGIIAKRIADRLGWYFSVGEPMIEHRKASNPFKNLVKEAPGIAMNETFWEAIDDVKLTCDTAISCLLEMSARLRENPDDYIAQLGKALSIWAKFFVTRPNGI